MIFITGAYASGKHQFVRALGYAQPDILKLEELSTHEFQCLGTHAAPKVVSHTEELARAGAPDKALISWLSHCHVVVATEVGAGVVPLDPQERLWRERAGRLACELAARADVAIRLVAGIAQVIHDSGRAFPGREKLAAALAPAPALATPPSAPSLQLFLMRHGKTAGNEEHRYVGATDEPLSETGRREVEAAGVMPYVPLVYVSPYLRAVETAKICFPNAEYVQVDGLKEMNFGAFEMRSAQEMETDPDYTAWVDGMCQGRCPGGESMQEFSHRSSQALFLLVEKALARRDTHLWVVAHGGTIMSCMDAFATPHENSYFSWHVNNAEGYVATAVLEAGKLQLLKPRRIAALKDLAPDTAQQ
ncbi:MAG: bifunctional adenosylcobinamide kinase/adenosylcobinamide-phosphate guanylyltransferase [Atopobiaceae bacterium]|jgi:alpha-ribazole phosphatase